VLSDPALAHELLGAAANLLAGCSAAKAAAVEDVDGGDGGKPASLAARLLRLAFRNTSPASTTRLALAPLASLAGDAASRRWLLRSPFLGKVMEAFMASVGRRDGQRQVALLRAMADVAGGGGEDGRKALMHAGGAELVQLLLEVLAAAGVTGGGDGEEEDGIDIISSAFGALSGNGAGGAGGTVFHPQLPVAALEALLLLRNLCFHPDAKAHVSANPRAIDALVAAAGAGDPVGAVHVAYSSNHRWKAPGSNHCAYEVRNWFQAFAFKFNLYRYNPGARASAADALLALVHNGQRIAALLRGGHRAARIRRAAGKAYRAVAGAEGGGITMSTAGGRSEAVAHSSKCLAALVAVLGVGGNDPASASSPDSTLMDIDEDELGLGEECSDGNAIGPRWVH
jgi:hypothetical protein